MTDLNLAALDEEIETLNLNVFCRTLPWRKGESICSYCAISLFLHYSECHELAEELTWGEEGRENVRQTLILIRLAYIDFFYGGKEPK